MDIYEFEDNGYRVGRNPLFGEWTQAFDIKPVANGRRNNAEKQAFYQSVRDALTNRYIYTHQVAVEITLHHDQQDRLETTLLGDLDNYAKTICDAISGSDGILIDDCQIQSLKISWIDRNANSPEFEVAVKARPDEFQPTPVKLYGMPDGLYYPLSDDCWTQEGTVAYPEGVKELTLLVWKELTQGVVEQREMCQGAGDDRATAFQRTMGLKPQPWGFNRNRLNESGFQIFRIEDWIGQIEQWLPTCTSMEMNKLISDRMA